MNLHFNCCRILSALICMGICSGALADTGTAQKPPQDSGLREVGVATTGVGEASKTVPPTLAATVDGRPISIKEFDALCAEMIRKRFFHGAPSSSEVEAVRKEAMELLIENVLLVEEAERRGFKPDEAEIKRFAADMEARYGAMPAWQKDREQALATMREQVGRENLIKQARKALREVAPPTPAEVRVFYEQKPELFTEPEKLRLSLILLKVDPGSPKADWDKAREEAKRIFLRLKGGADFAELARKYSDDVSAGSGGDIGYVHAGMLPEKLQGKINKLQIGVVDEPLAILEGVALYRLDERVAPVLREFTKVAQRAQDLLVRDKVEKAWKEAIDRLRGNAKIEILVPIANDSVKSSGGLGEPQLIAPTSGNKQEDGEKKGW